MTSARIRITVLLVALVCVLLAVPALAQDDDIFDILDIKSSDPIPPGSILTIPGDSWVSNATFGTAFLEAGFLPDPYLVNMTSGGEYSATAWLGDECPGYVADTPDFELHWWGMSPQLYIGFAAYEGDTTMVVLAPDGWYYCSDDVHGLDPEVYFERPLAGTYYIWVGSYSSGQYHDGELFITEIG